MIQHVLDAAPDIHTVIERAFPDPDNEILAVRLVSTCRPVKEFMGVVSDGKAVRFVEHVFYRFEAGKIREGWSVFDAPKAVD